MQIIITGGAGFLGQMLAKKIASGALVFTELLLVDIAMPPKVLDDERIKHLQYDLSKEGAAEAIISGNTGLIFHLAAVVSSHAEADFDMGWRVNVQATNYLLEACRKQNTKIKFVFASSCAVFGGNLPPVLTDSTALHPQSSYGSQKAIAELMVHDYTRKGYLQGISLRLPTVCVRPGKPNLAASSFVSAIIREPINGQEANCPVPVHLPVWVASPLTIIDNFIHAAHIASHDLGPWNVVNLPGISVRISEMLSALEKIGGKACLEKVSYRHDEAIAKIVLSWPSQIDNNSALAMGFKVDTAFDDFILQYKASR